MGNFSTTFLLIFLLQFATYNAFNSLIGNQLKLVLEGWYQPPEFPNYTMPEQPPGSSPCPMPQPPPRPVQCPRLDDYENNYFSNEVDDFVSGLFNSTPNILDPYASEFQQVFKGIPTQIAAKVEGIVEGLPRTQHQPSRMSSNFDMEVTPRDMETCQKMAVFNMMGTHPKMNYKFWLKALNHVILTNPELGDQLDFDPMTKLDRIRTFRRFKRRSVPPPVEGGRNHPCPAYPPDDYRVVPFSSFVPSSESCVGREGTVSIPAENDLWYFREDLGINLYHAHWHNLHPVEGKVCRESGTGRCHSERRGELFYYFHRNLLARYDTERMTHGIPPVSPFHFRTGVNVNPGYNPGKKLSGNGYDSRAADLILPYSLNIKRGEFHGFLHQISMIENLTDSFFQFRSRSGPTHAVDELMHAIEASDLSQHNNYGSIHNTGHLFLSDFGSPGTHSFSAVMAQPHLSLRDPLFYRWHRYVDNLLKKHKNRLQPYSINQGDFPLSWNSVNVNEISVASLDGSSTTNVLNTFWRQRKYSPDTECRKYLDHQGFQFTIKIRNNDMTQRRGTVRTFLAPKTDQNGVRLSLEEQRDYIFPLDVVNVDLSPGNNIVKRNSTWLATASPRFNDKSLQENREGDEAFCGCGHPHNLFIPKGNDCGGDDCALIVLVTDGSRYPFNFTEDPGAKCYRPPVTCGIQGQGEAEVVLPFGYPFDRKLAGGYAYIEDLTEKLGNMKAADIKIVHQDVLLTIYEDINSFRETVVNRGSTNPKCQKGRGTLRHGGNVSTPIDDCWHDLSGSRSCGPIPPSYDCVQQHGLNFCRPWEPLPLATPPPTTPPLAASQIFTDCWYEYSGVRNCLPIPPHYNCAQYYGQKYCKPGTLETTSTTTTSQPVTECWFEYSGVQTCRPIPPDYQCGQHYGRKYCQPVAITTTTTARPSTDCFYDQNNYKHCHPPRPDSICYYNYGTKYCHHPDQTTTTPAPTTLACYYGYCGNTLRGYYAHAPTSSYGNAVVGRGHTNSYHNTPSQYATNTGYGYGYYGQNTGGSGYQYGHSYQGYGGRK